LASSGTLLPGPVMEILKRLVGATVKFLTMVVPFVRRKVAVTLAVCAPGFAIRM
jgi:hypothetical protein